MSWHHDLSFQIDIDSIKGTILALFTFHSSQRGEHPPVTGFNSAPLHTCLFLGSNTSHVRQGTWEDGAKKSRSASWVFIGGIIHPSAPQLKPLGPRQHLHVRRCFLWNFIMFLLVNSNPQCHRGNLGAIVGLCFTRPDGNHVFDLVHTSVYYSTYHYWNMRSASRLRTSVFSLRFANGAFLKRSMKQVGKMMSRQKVDVDNCFSRNGVFTFCSARLVSPAWLPWCVSPVSRSLSPLSHCLSPSYWLDSAHIYPSRPAAIFPSQCCVCLLLCVVETWGLLSELFVEWGGRRGALDV